MSNNAKLGLRFMLLSALFFSLMNVMARMVPRISAVELAFFRSIITAALSFSILRIKKESVWGNRPGLLLLRGAFGTVGLILYFSTLRAMDLATAVVIQYTSPLFAALIAWLVLGEKSYRLQWLFLGVCLVGVAMVKGFGAVDTGWFIVGIVSAMFSGMAYNVIRKLKNTESPNVILFYFPVVTLPVTLIWFFARPQDWVMPMGIEWLYLLLFGLCTQGGQYFMTRAYQTAAVNQVTAGTYTGVVYSLFFGWFLFNESVSWLVLAGMLLIVAGIILNTRVQHWMNKRNVPHPEQRNVKAL